MTETTLSWWALLCTVSAVNAMAWTASVLMLRRQVGRLDPLTWAAMRLQMLLSAGYVLGCGFRSWFPVFDVRRLCLVDSWLSSVIVGRSVATFAELCFAAQWALLLRGAAASTGSRFGLTVSRLILPLISVAELCSWHAVLTTANLGHVLEESLWGLCAALLVASLVFIWPRSRPQARPLLAVATVFGLGYVAYMFRVDVPMYWSRWLLDEAQGVQYLSVAQGLVDASQRWVVSHQDADWRDEYLWMAMYFSVAVWLSIGLMHWVRHLGPVPEAGGRPSPAKARIAQAAHTG